MIKGLLILFTVFAVVALLNFSSLRLMKLEAVKKAKFRKVFFYFYGLFLIFSGVLNMFEKSEFNIIFFIEILAGLIFIIGNYLGKLEERKAVEWRLLKCITMNMNTQNKYNYKQLK